MSPLSLDDRSDDAERLAEAVHVRHGPRGSGALRQAGYVLYVAALLGATWGVALARGVMLQFDMDTVSVEWDQPLGWLALGAASFGVVVLIRRAGRVRGPAVPTLPWIDLIATTAIDRAWVLRESWRVALVLCVGIASISGAVAGLTGWITGSLTPPWITGGALAGAVLGWVGATMWLSGQASAHVLRGGWSITGRGPRRQIPLDRLREQSARSQLLHGSVLVGDLRVAQLSIHPPRAFGRFQRLRSAGPTRTLIRRDLLGYRRGPGTVLNGFILVALGVGGTSWILNNPSVPIVLALLPGIAGYFGCGAWCEGLRLQADTTSAPALIGMAPHRQLLAHLIAPLLASLVVGLPAAAGVSAVLTEPLTGDTLHGVAITVGWALVLVMLFVAGQAWAAFRRSVPFALVTLYVGPAITAVWYAVPLLVVAITGGVLTDQLADSPTWWPWPMGTATAAGMLSLAIAGLNRETDAHRT